ncbi:substrate-binding domain-containing protein [Actinoallomurus iriomotensis]|uniref:VWFA domain-containing protein n=1 Tax=Actinoallomurus iriomotensis TaxID=478107 RepID=A0A9W6RZW0_9ACTN|nr:substrate-binding domain-containing protein [Actinoallomurus iriomotensis]GLY85320.1 hypothetical protein Airi02_032490 [Actinoallomurus iriomotensis]
MAVAFALVLGLLLGVGGWMLTGGGSGCGHRVRLSVAADPAISPAISAMADRFGKDRCVTVTVAASTAADQADALAAGDTRRPDVWIPDSSLWLDITVGGRTTLPSAGTSVAASPMVFALPSGEIGRRGAILRQRSWQALADGGSGFALRLYDPLRTATGMASLLAVQRVTGSGDRALPAFSRLLQGAQATTTIESATELTSTITAASGQGPTPLLVLSEEALWQQNRRGSRTQGRFAALQAAGGMPNLDFPYVTVASDATVRRTAQDFLAALRSDAGVRAVHRIGLRSHDGTAGPELTSAGMARTAPAPVAVARPGAARMIRQTWRQMQLGIRGLALVDVSGSMLDPMPGSHDTRIQAVTHALSSGMALVPDDTEFGVWAFSTGLDHGLPYRQVVPVTELGTVTERGTGRALLQEKMARLRPKPDGDTGLYDSVLAAYQEMQKGYRADKFNFVLVLTDGRNDYDEGITLDTLLQRLRRNYDPRRPVSIITMGFGGDIDTEALGQIANVTQGAQYSIDDPKQIVQLFLRSTAMRACGKPGCAD